MLKRLQLVESELGLADEGDLADYLHVSAEDIRMFKASPEDHPLPAAGKKALGVAWRYVVTSNAVLAVLPKGLREWARAWERSRALVLARQRAGRK